MKAILNKKFDTLLSFINLIWSQRNMIRNKIGDCLELEDFKFAPLKTISRDVVDSVWYSTKMLQNGGFKTRNEFRNSIIDDKLVSFYEEFVKRIVK